MILELTYQGPGTGDFTSYLWQVAAILLGSFLLGFWLRSLLNSKYKNEIKDLEDENAILRSKSVPEKPDTSAFESKIAEQQKEIARLSNQLSDAYAAKVKLENEAVSLKNQVERNKSIPPVKESKLQESISSVPVVESKPKNEPSPSEESLKSGATSKTPKKETVTTKPKASNQTDLKRIEGIGPKIASLLNDGGISTFSDLANASVDSIREILIAAGSNYAVHDPTTWSQQAKMAMEENWEELQDFQDQLKGGRKT